MKTIDLPNEPVSFGTSILRKRYEQFRQRYSSSRVGKPIIVIGVFLLLTSIYLYASRMVLHDGDNASILLQAYDLIHKSKILNGWALAGDNFITLDMPWYALGLLLGFNMHVLMKVVPALIYTGIIFSGMYLTSIGKVGNQKLFAIIVFLAIVAFPSYDITNQVLQGPVHLGTILGTLLAFMTYYAHKEHSHKKISLLILSILTVLLVIGDPMSEMIMVLPLVLVEAILLYKNKFSSRDQYFVIGGVLLGTLLALYMRHVWVHYVQLEGGDNLQFVDLPRMVKDAGDAVQIIFSLFHGSFFQQDVFSLHTIPLLLNGVAVILLGVGVWKWFKSKLALLYTPQDALTAVLVLALTSNIIVYICTNVAGVPILRYLLPVFVFGGIVAFSLLSYIKKRELYIGIVALFVLNSSLFIYILYSTPPVTQPEKAVVAFLQEKHLSKGIGQYWSAAGITGQSSYTITVRQVLVEKNRIHPYLFLMNKYWFDYNNIKDSQFIIYTKSDNGFYTASIHSFGRPDHIYAVNNYIILAWNTPLFKHVMPRYNFWATL